MKKIKINHCNYHCSNPPKDEISRPHGSGDYLLLHFHTEMKAELKNKIVEIHPGGCILFSPDAAQRYWAVNQFTNSFIHFEVPDESIISAYGLPLDEVFYPRETEKVEKLFKRLYTEYLDRAPHFEQMQDFILREIFIEFSRQLSVPFDRTDIDMGIYDRFRQARLEILSQPEREWTSENMAALTNMGSSQFYHYYKKFFENSPKAELLEIRLENAKYLLKNESLPVGQVAVKCGFHDTSHFIRYFKKNCGFSPLKYRNRC